MPSLLFGIAATAEDLRDIRALNYRTFVEEIPQHGPNSELSLPDRFENENTYFVCRCGNDIVGMIAVRCNRPFSLDAKVPGLDGWLPPHKSPCEIRLLAIAPRHRRGRILAGLMGMVVDYFETRGHDLALISGTLRQTKLYAHLGFTAFGPVVGSPEAPYQPMYQSVEHFRLRTARLGRVASSFLSRRDVNLLPGPIYLAPAVQAALGAKPISHRTEAFEHRLDRTRHMLCELSHAPAVAVALGSGTLANDLVAGQLAQIPGRGLILVNGEFGQRLADHAARLQMDFDTVDIAWGNAFTEDDLDRALSHGSPKSWLWAVHAETSTGVLNDLDMLKRLAHKWRLRLGLDCISSLGAVPCDLRGVALASGASGKGLRSLAGLALVFHDKTLPAPTRPLPRYLDLGLYLGRGVPFTLPSNLVTALCLALETLVPDNRYREIRQACDWLCPQLQAAGLTPLAAEPVRFPGAITIPLPAHVDSCELGQSLQRLGWLLSFQSPYLINRNWIQICLLGRTERSDLEPLPRLLAKLVHSKET